MKLVIKDRTLIKKPEPVREIDVVKEPEKEIIDNSELINTLMARVIEIGKAVDSIPAPKERTKVVATIQRDKDGKMTHIIINEQ